MSSNPTSPTSMGGSKPIAARSRIQAKLTATVMLVAIVPVILLEVLHHFEVDPADSGQLLLRILCILVSVAFALALSLYTSGGWVRQIASIKNTLDSLASGESNARAEIFSNDELGSIAVALNSLRDASTSGSPGVRECVRLQGPLEALTNSSLQLSATAVQLEASTKKLSQESEVHTAQVNDTSAAVDEIVESIRNVAENTSTSAQVAGEARQTATVGSQAVSNTIQGMQRIRDQVQSTSKRIKQLGESAQQIGEIVQLISDVADRTSLLALNASIQAAMAGEAGQGFGVVAEEVEHLSKRCNDATKQMSKLVKSVQSGTAEAIAGMEESIAEVVEGSKLASQAGEALADIDAVSNRLAELINSISTAAKQQARGGLLASRSMNEISAVMHENAVGTKQTAQSVSQIVALAGELSSSAQRVRTLAVHQAVVNEMEKSSTAPEADVEPPESDAKQSAPTPLPETLPTWSSPVTADSSMS